MAENNLRDLIFVSHATPEDNDFALWISLQLAKEGYRVWCDLTDLLGGEKFYNDIDTAIGQHAIKFLFVLSKTSHDPEREGPQEELIKAKNTAKNEKLKDFIIPLSIDGVAHRAKFVALGGLNSIPFEESWADGLRRLLKKLEKDSVPKNGRFNPEAVSSWWRAYANAEQGIRRENETLHSNWFLLDQFPALYLYRTRRYRTGRTAEPKFPFPTVKLDTNRWAAFASVDTFVKCMTPPWEMEDFNKYSTSNFLDGISERDNRSLTKKLRRDTIYQLLNQAWLQMVSAKGLPLYELANESKCFYFPSGHCEKDRVYFADFEGKTISRTVAGNYRNRGFWHFAIQAKPLVNVHHNTFGFIVKPHVLFSEDGKDIWLDKRQLHVARRKKCKSWWNPEWRDHILAAMAFLADEHGNILLQLAPQIETVVSSRPLTIEVPITFSDPPAKSLATKAKEDGHTDDLSIEFDDEDEDLEEDWDELSETEAEANDLV